jgi:hypothetical protein
MITTFDFFIKFPLVTFVFLATFIASLLWSRHVLIFICSLLASFLGFIITVGGLHNLEALQAGIGWGVLFMIPAGGGCFFATYLGYIISSQRKKNKH